MRLGKPSRGTGDRGIVTPKPGPRCVTPRVLVVVWVDVADALNTLTRTCSGVRYRTELRGRGLTRSAGPPRW